MTQNIVNFIKIQTNQLVAPEDQHAFIACLIAKLEDVVFPTDQHEPVVQKYGNLLTELLDVIAHEDKKDENFSIPLLKAQLTHDCL